MPPAVPPLTIAAGVLAMVMFSGNFVASRHGLANGLSVWDLVLLRYAVAGALFAVVLWRIGLGGLSAGRVAALTALGGAPYFLLTALGVVFAPATHASILNPGGTTVFAPLLGWLVLREAPSPGLRLGIPVTLAGLLLIGGGSLLEREGEARVWLGDLLLLWSGFNWALYGVLIRRWGVGGLRAAAVIGAFSLAWVPPHLVLFGLGGILAAWPEALVQAGYQGLFAGGLAVILYSHCYAVLGPARAALFPPLVPVLGVLLAALVLGEAVTLLQVLGMATVIAGMLVGALWRRRSARATGGA